MILDTCAPFPIASIRSEEIAFLRERLHAHGFEEEEIARRLHLPHLYCLRPEMMPLDLRNRLDAPDLLNTLVKLFLLQQRMPERDVRRIFTEKETAFLVHAGIVQCEGSSVVPAVSLYPCMDAVVATDHRFLSVGREEVIAERVMHLGKDSYDLAYGAVRAPVEKTLDLCTGSGVHAILAARHSRRVAGVDLNRRALCFGELNRRINGAGNVDFMLSDLDREVRDAPYDLILINPPFVPSLQAEVLFRDGGATGEHILLRFLNSLGGILEVGGICFISTVMAFQEHIPYLDKLSSWLPADEFNICVLLYSTMPAESYFLNTAFTSGVEARAEHLRRIIDFDDLRRLHRVETIGHGLIALQRAPAPPVWKKVREIKIFERHYGEKVRSYFALQNALLSRARGGEPRDLALRLSPDVETFWRSDSAPPAGMVEFRHSSWSLPARLDGEETALVERCLPAGSGKSILISAGSREDACARRLLDCGVLELSPDSPTRQRIENLKPFLAE